MKRLSARGVRLKQHIVLTKGDETIVDTFRRKKTMIMAVAQAKKWKEGEYSVDYGHGMKNSATIRSMDDLKYFIRAFTEKPLLDFIEMR